MKRSFSQFDECIPPVVWEHFPEQKKALDRIGRAERDLQRVWTAKRRAALATNSEPAILTKVMRVFVRSTFVAQTETEKSHFLVTIEGRMLESKLSEHHHFGFFFDSIKLAVDKRNGSTSQLSMLEWDAARSPEGRKADCFRFKVYHDKACFVKFYLTRSSEVQPRYDLPPCVRDILPNIRWDPTEQDIFLAIWSYIMEHGLVDSRSKSLIKADEALKQALGGTDLIQVPALRQKVLEQCSPARAIVVEYTLSVPKASEAVPDSDARFSRAALENAGGRTFDLDVDILDPLSFEIMAELNRSVEKEQASEAALREMTPTINYLCKSIMRESFTAFPAVGEGTVLDPLRVGEESYRMNDMFNIITTRPNAKDPVDPNTDTPIVSASVGGKESAKSQSNLHVVNAFPDGNIRVHSAVHNFRGYIDVADDSCFVDVPPPQPENKGLMNIINVTADSSVAASCETTGGDDAEKSNRVSWLREASSALLPRVEKNSRMDIDG